MTSGKSKIKIKRSMDSLDLHYAIKEMEVLSEAFLNKVYRPGSGLLVFRFNTKEEGRKDLLIDLGNRMHFVEKPPENPTTPDSFTTFLRKNLGNARLIGIRQLDFDRIVALDFEREQKWSLVLEMFRGGNLLLIENGVIKVPLFKREYRHRSLAIGEEYVPPPSGKDPRSADVRILKEVLSESDSLGRGLAFGLNLGPRGAEEVVTRTGWEFHADPNELDDSDLEELLKAMDDMLLEKTSPRIYLKDGTPYDFSPIGLESMEEEETEKNENFSLLLETYFNRIRDLVDKEEPPALKALRRTAKKQKERIAELEEEADKTEKMAQYIYEHYGEIEKVLIGVKEAAERSGWNRLKEMAGKKDAIVRSLDPRKGTGSICLSQGEPELHLDFNMDPNANASRIYNEAKKMRKKVEGAENALKETREKINNFVVEEEEDEKGPRRRKEWYQNYRWMFTSQGNLVVAGRDARSNERVVRKYLKDNDRYVHADLPGAPSTVVRKNDEGDISEESLEEGCAFAVINSKAWKTGLASASAYWVKPEQVSKTPQSGEYLPKGSFVIRGKRNYVHKIPMECAVGKGEIDGTEKVMGGPLSAVEEHCNEYILLGPGNVKKETLANKLSSTWSIPQSEILSVLPPGGVRLLRTHGFAFEL